MRVFAALLLLLFAAPGLAHEREMIEAIGRGDLAAMRAELDGGANPTGGDDPTPMATWLPVYYAAEAGRADMLATLIEFGADIDRRDRNGDRPLDWAARYGEVEIMRLLLQAGADPDEPGNRGTPLIQALGGGHYTAAALLLDTMEAQGGPQRGELHSALYVAAKGRDLDLARRIIEAGADPDGHQGHTGERALHEAAFGSTPEMVALLISAGADLEARNEKGETPLFYAAKYGKAETLPVLLEAGADPDARDHRFITPIVAALSYRPKPEWDIGFDDGRLTNAELAARGETKTYRNYHDVVALLAEHTEDLHGALASAVWGGYGDVARRLIERGARAIGTDDHLRPPHDGRSAGLTLIPGPWVLGGAARHPGLEMFDLLLGNGASIERQGEEALRYAAIMGRADIARRLLDAGTAPDKADSFGYTPLLHAATEGHAEVARLLVDRGADVPAQRMAEAMSARIQELVCLAASREMSRAWKPTHAIRGYVAELSRRHDILIAALDLDVPSGAAMLAAADSVCDGYN